MDRRPSPPGPADVHATFEHYSSHGAMDAMQFHKFLVEVQQEHLVSEADAKRFMEARLNDPRHLTFTEQNFLDHLFDAGNNLAINTRVHHDMTRPMSHYFIFTGHNSYLTGNQLSSACSEKPIIEALLRGVRVVELDLWPNSEKDNILVLHGRTLTSPVAFQKCISAIKENAFVKSNYPVVVTLEDHLPPELQAKAAKAITETFGAALFYPESVEGLQEFPSPESLKQRILISTKPPTEYLGAKNADTSKTLEQNIAVEEAKTKKHSIWGQEIPGFSHHKTATDKTIPTSLESGHEDDDISDEESKPPERREETLVSPEYKKIITIRAGKPKGKSLVDALKEMECAKRVSLSEPQFAKIAALHPSNIIQFTHRNFLRIYPKGLRIDSSNYNPIQAWSHGAQMVAANMQGYGRYLWIAQGFFRANGGCGYVKKPSFLLPQNSGSFSNIYDPADPKPPKQLLKVKVYMGHGWLEQFGKRSFDRFSAPDFYTRVGIAGVKADTVMKKTAVLEDNWVPLWDEEFHFELTVPELAVLRIEVHEYDKTGKDDFAGQTCLLVSELKPGYRAIPLCDEKGNELQLVRLLLRLELLPH